MFNMNREEWEAEIKHKERMYREQKKRRNNKIAFAGIIIGVLFLFGSCAAASNSNTNTNNNSDFNWNDPEDVEGFIDWSSERQEKARIGE